MNLVVDDARHFPNPREGQDPNHHKLHRRGNNPRTAAAPPLALVSASALEAAASAVLAESVLRT